MSARNLPPTVPDAAPPLLGWRLLALVYDLLPALGLWIVVAAVFVALHGDAVTGGALGLLEFAALWAVTGGYAVVSWRFGGQTLGMRPWRLRVVDASGGRAGYRALVVRYVVGGASLLLAGAGFWWALVGRDRLTWHDRASGTRLVRGAR